jgi:hypothetical protein
VRIQFYASADSLLDAGDTRVGQTDIAADRLGGSGDTADHFGAGTLARLRVSGDIDDSLIVIGVDPHNGRYRDGDDRQLGTSTNRVQELLVGGRLTGDTQISAPAFPASVRASTASCAARRALASWRARRPTAAHRRPSPRWRTTAAFRRATASRATRPSAARPATLPA